MADGLLNQTENLYISQKLAYEAMEILRVRGLKIALAESCTGGLLSYHFTVLSGASDILDGAIVSYANTMKTLWLGVDAGHLQMYGAVSEYVVRAMCVGLLKRSQADVVLATSGVAGPAGGTESNPTGSVYIGLQCRGQEAEVVYYQFAGDRIQVQAQACKKALELLVQRLNI